MVSGTREHAEQMREHAAAVLAPVAATDSPVHRIAQKRRRVGATCHFSGINHGLVVDGGKTLRQEGAERGLSPGSVPC